MDWIAFSIGMTPGFILGVIFGIYIITTRIKKAFESAAGSMAEYFKDATIENDPSLGSKEYQEAIKDRSKVED